MDTMFAPGTFMYATVEAAAYLEGVGADEVEEVIAELREELMQLEGDDTLFTMTLYIQGDYVVGLVITEPNGLFTFTYKCLEVDDQMHLELTLEIGPVMVDVSFVGEFTHNGIGWSGSPVFSVVDHGPWGGEFAFSFEVEDLRMDGDFILGNIHISGEIDDIFMPIPYDVTIAFVRDGDIQRMTVTGTVMGVDIGTLIIAMSYSYNIEFAAPVINHNFAVDVMGTSLRDFERTNAMTRALTEYNELTRFIAETIMSMFFMMPPPTTLPMPTTPEPLFELEIDDLFEIYEYEYYEYYYDYELEV
jgi:hypothetical protein